MTYAKTLTAALVVAAVLIMPAVSAAEEGRQDFTLANKTGYTISEVYVSPSKASDWQEDVLGEDTLGNNESTHITFHRKTHPCLWDLKVVYQEDDSTAQWTSFNLCTISRINIYYDEDSETTSATYE